MSDFFEDLNNMLRGGSKKTPAEKNMAKFSEQTGSEEERIKKVLRSAEKLSKEKGVAGFDLRKAGMVQNREEADKVTVARVEELCEKIPESSEYFVIMGTANEDGDVEMCIAGNTSTGNLAQSITKIMEAEPKLREAFELGVGFYNHKHGKR